MNSKKPVQGRHRGDQARLTRRDVLKMIAGAGAGLVVGTAGAEPVGSMLKRRIPRSGEMLPAVGLGTARTFDVGTGEQARATLKEVLRLFVELGGSAVDSSPMYGNAETVVGDLAAGLGVQGSLFLATKVWTEGRDAGIRQMEQSMRRMRSKRIDLMQVHNLVDTQTQLRTLREWKKTGKIRYLGVTHYVVGAFDELEKLIKNESLDFVQLPYSIATREAEQRLLPLAADTGTAVMVNRPFEKADLFHKVRGRKLPDWAGEFDCHSWAQFFLKYIFSHSAVTCAIPATRKPKHLADNMRSGYGRLPDKAMRRRMVGFIEQL